MQRYIEVSSMDDRSTESISALMDGEVEDFRAAPYSCASG